MALEFIPNHEFPYNLMLIAMGYTLKLCLFQSTLGYKYLLSYPEMKNHVVPSTRKGEKRGAWKVYNRMQQVENDDII